jgi:hypothetical protein
MTIQTQGAKPPDIKNLKIYPDMTRWFNPILLGKLLLNVVTSGMFGQYADRRLMIAALDTNDTDILMQRAHDAKLPINANGEAWFDFVADLGDGFDSTYAIAYLLGQRSLNIGGHDLPRGDAIVFGSDEVYPVASGNAYHHQFGDPYAFANPDPAPHSNDGIPAYAIPGNHDWYDGLQTFLAFFTREHPWHFGAWRTRQRRSYFALQLTDQWWLWCTDIQLADDMDQPQADYFTKVAVNMPEGARVIVASAEPGWLYTVSNRRSFDILDYTAWIARNARKNFTVPLLLSGDTHHYSRYATDKRVQFLVAGGGGAFLHPTHQLEDQISFELGGVQCDLSLKRDPVSNQPTDKAACYPSQAESRKLVLNNLWFPVTNWDFAVLMGIIYWIFSIGISLRDSWDAYIIAFLIFAWAFVGYTRRQERSDAAVVYSSGLLQGLAHTVTVIWLTQDAINWNAEHLQNGDWWDVWLWAAALFVEVGILGGIIGGFIFGLNLLITCRFFKINTNDAFSALRLNTYKNFLRICIKDNQMTIYPIGLDAVPARDGWDANNNPAPGVPVFMPRTPLAPHLIEKPIVIKA